MKLITLIFLCLLIAFILGLILGYIIRGWRCKKESEELVKPSILLDEQPETKDDLQKINGIGPVFEEMLNKLGIYKYEQLAKLSKSDIKWVAYHIEAFPDRIYEDKWVEQAKQLVKEQEKAQQ